MHRRRLPYAVLAALAATLACAPGALAAGHAHRISGRVLRIDVRRHTLALRANASGVHTARAGGGRVFEVAFGHASVSGPDGAVAVGDEVTVTTGASTGPTAVATSIDVIGQPSGGDAGHGAAVPGTVTALDPADGQLTLSVTSTGAQGSQSSSVVVTVGASTILAVGDTNGDGAVTLADIGVGDRLIVFTPDAAGDPLTALGILDVSRGGSDHQDGGDGPQRTAIPGTVASIDAAGSTVQMTVGGDGPLAGSRLLVTVTTHTSFGGGHGGFGLADIAAGDQIVVYAPGGASGGAVTALAIVDESARRSAGEGQGSPDSAQPIRFGGAITDLRPDGLTVEVTSDGALAGQTVIVAVRASTRVADAAGTGSGPRQLAGLAVGDRVEIEVADPTATPLVAVAVIDDSHATGSQGHDG